MTKKLTCGNMARHCFSMFQTIIVVYEEGFFLCRINKENVVTYSELMVVSLLLILAK